jgi:hypothetical protein
VGAWTTETTHPSLPGVVVRFTGVFADGGNTIAGTWQLSRDDVHCDDDLQITFRRQLRSS